MANHKEKLRKRISAELERLELEEPEPEDFFRRTHRDLEIAQLKVFQKWNEKENDD